MELKCITAPGLASVSSEDTDSLAGYPDSSELLAHSPALHFLGLESENRRVVARASVWWMEADGFSQAEQFAKPDEKVAILGNFSAVDRSAGSEFLNILLDSLGEIGADQVVGPMDGNTWRRYRLRTWSSQPERPAFAIEPGNPDWYVEIFESAGFKPLARYYSSICTKLDFEDERVKRVASRLNETGIRIRPLKKECFESELEKIHELSLASFKDNFLYTPLPAAMFINQYLPYRDAIMPELVLLAELPDNSLAGYVFAIPDLANPGSETAILKTLAVRPGRAFMGLGSLLLQEVHNHCRQAGFTAVIHALMHEANRSMNLSKHYTQVFRRYTLFRCGPPVRRRKSDS